MHAPGLGQSTRPSCDLAQSARSATGRSGPTAGPPQTGIRTPGVQAFHGATDSGAGPAAVGGTGTGAGAHAPVPTVSGPRTLQRAAAIVPSTTPAECYGPRAVRSRASQKTACAHGRALAGRMLCRRHSGAESGERRRRGRATGARRAYRPDNRDSGSRSSRGSSEEQRTRRPQQPQPCHGPRLVRRRRRLGPRCGLGPAGRHTCVRVRSQRPHTHARRRSCCYASVRRTRRRSDPPRPRHPTVRPPKRTYTRTHAPMAKAVCVLTGDKGVSGTVFFTAEVRTAARRMCRRTRRHVRLIDGAGACAMAARWTAHPR